MKNKRQNSASVNILRDSQKQLDYITTPNASSIFKRIINYYNNENQRAFCIIGSYGTGKSSFLWALEKNLKNEQSYFLDITGKFEKVKKFEFIKLVGEIESLQKSLANHLEIEESNSKSILNRLKQIIQDHNSKGVGLALVIDEFGKFVEHIIRNNQIQEFYFLQQVAEIANDNEVDFTFILTLHQDLSLYLNNSEQDLCDEWKKVSGRYLNLLFNEPVEQLIFFAREKLKNLQSNSNLNDEINELNRLIYSSKLVTNIVESNNPPGKEVFPLDWLSINVLVAALQKHGQNERSIFTFLESTDDDSISLNQNRFYTVSNVYDYLIKRLYHNIFGSDNTNKGQWQAIFKALDKAEVLFEKDLDIYQDIIKSIGLVNIFCKSGGHLDEIFLKKYFYLTRGVNIGPHIEKLIKNKFIRFFKHRNKLNFIDGTDLDLDLELNLISKEIPVHFQIGDAIEKYIDFPLIVAKKVSFETGTTRLFQYQIYKKNMPEISRYIDGTIQLIFDDLIDTDEIIKTSIASSAIHLYVKFNNIKKIRNEIIEIKKYELLIQKFNDDRVAANILNDEKNYHETNLRSFILNYQFSENVKQKNTNQWIHNGKTIFIPTSKKLNNYLSVVCEKNYYKTPIFKNELINREHLTTPINTARKILFRNLLSENVQLENLGFDSNKYPPEKSIYLSLLKKTGIHQQCSTCNFFKLTEPTDDSFRELWEHCKFLLSSAENNKIPISRFFDELSNPEIGFKLKRGFLEIWIPLFLISQKDRFAIYHESSGYIPYLTAELMDLMHKSPGSYLIKSYGETNIPSNLLEKYREITSATKTSQSLNSSFISIFSNFLRFYKSLNEYGKNTNTVSPQGISIRKAIMEAKDPESALFEEIPKALYFSKNQFQENPETLNIFTTEILSALDSIRDAYPQLLNRIEKTLFDSFNINSANDFKSKKLYLLQIFNGNLNESYLGQNSLIFYKRLTSQLDERESYLKSVADVALGMSIDKLKDEQEPLLHKTLVQLCQGLLDSLVLQKSTSYNISSNSQLIKISTSNINGEITQKTLLKSDELTEQKKTKFESITKRIKEDDYSDLIYYILNQIKINEND